VEKGLRKSARGKRKMILKGGNVMRGLGKKKKYVTVNSKEGGVKKENLVEIRK